MVAYLIDKDRRRRQNFLEEKNYLARLQHLLKHVAIAVEQEYALAAVSRELINEQACAAEEDVGGASNKCEVVVHVRSCQ